MVVHENSKRSYVKIILHNSFLSIWDSAIARCFIIVRFKAAYNGFAIDEYLDEDEVTRKYFPSVLQSGRLNNDI